MLTVVDVLNMLNVNGGRCAKHAPSIKVGHSCRMQKTHVGLLPPKILCFAVPFKEFIKTLP